MESGEINRAGPRPAGDPPASRRVRTRSERDAEHRVVLALEQRGFTVGQDVAVSGAGRKVTGEGLGRVDIYAERGDFRLIVEMKRPDQFRTESQRAKAMQQANRYGDQLGSLYVATSDGETLIVEYKGERYVHQVGSGLLLPVDGRKSPLDVGAVYDTFASFPQLQRAGHFFDEDTSVEREAIFDGAAFIASAEVDAILVAGEAGAGKTTYAQQITSVEWWDPLWLDGGAIDDPRAVLERAIEDLSGFTGGLRAFVTTLNAYRGRDGGLPSGIVVDALDEWGTAQRHLPELLRFAKEVGLKVIAFGRARAVDSLLANERLASGLTIERYELHPFTDDERDRAELKYIARFNLRSTFEGRAKQMSRLPEMMAMISAAYAGEEVNPQVTEAELYERYREKKCGDVARRLNIEPARVHADIDAIAIAMLAADAVALPFSDAARISAHLDDLLVSGVLRKEGAPRNSRVRFRFGRVRDDALAALPVGDLFDKPIVGRSALDYVAAHNASTRQEYMSRAVAENVLDALFVARETGWWKEFGASVPTDISARERILVLSYAREHLAEVPELLLKFAADPRAARFAVSFNVPIPLTTWNQWLHQATDADSLNDVLTLTRRLLAGGTLTVSDAITAVDIARAALMDDRGFLVEGQAFWLLVEQICQRLEIAAARRLLRRTIPPAAIGNSSHGHPVAHYHGVRYPGEMMKCVGVVRERSTPRAFEACGSALLLRAYHVKFKDFSFSGREISGSSPLGGKYNDNGWLLDVIVPSMRILIAGGMAIEARLRDYRISCLHPAFRLRAMILAVPIAELEAIPKTMLAWRRDRYTGIPNLSNTLDARAAESHVLQEQALDDALERVSMPVSAVQVDAFHRRLASGNRRAIRQAERFLADPNFLANDYYTTEFFKRLNWARRRPTLAVRLLRAAMMAGYERFLLTIQPGYHEILQLALTRPRLQAMLVDLPGIADEFAASARTLPNRVRARLTPSLYERAGVAAKRDIIRWVHELPRAQAGRICRLALDEDFAIPEACSGDEELEHGRIPDGTFHDNLWFALAMCHKRWPTRWFRDLGVDLIDRAARFQSPVGVASTVLPIVAYVIELRRNRTVVARGIDFLLGTARKGGDNLRELAGSNLTQLYGGMTPQQRAHFFQDFYATPTIAKVVIDLARATPDDEAAVEQAVDHARYNPHRHIMAGAIWRQIEGEKRRLLPVEAAVVDALLEQSDEATVRELVHVATSQSHTDASAATALMLRIVARAMALAVELWAPYEMVYDWSAVPLEQLESLVARSVAGEAVGWVEVEVIAQGLASRTNAAEIAAVRSAFEPLCARYEAALEHFTQWRRSMAMG
jgi:hypothetical protein